jgi:hypothetical protein
MEGAIHVTHENIPNTEHDDGPEHDTTLPNAGDIPTFETAEESFLSPLDGDLED